MTRMTARAFFCPGGHAHDNCIAEALSRAQALCTDKGWRLTPIRQRVLELIWASHQPAKAYDLLAWINQERGNTAPPTVYRALDFLLAAGLIHKIESQSAYVGCAVEHDSAPPKFLICRQCGQAAEIQSRAIDQAIADKAQQAGFVIAHQTIEIDGLCAGCAARQTDTNPALR